MDRYREIERSLDRELSKYPIMLQLEHKTGMKKTNIIFGVVISVGLLILLSFIPDLVLALVAYVYPALMTVSAIESHDKQRDTHWLAYWLVMGAFGVVEALTGGIMARIIPFYAVIKLVACVWLFLPSTGGALLIYERAIRPIALVIRDHPAYKQMEKEAGRVAGKAGEVKAAAKEAKATINQEIKKVTNPINVEAAKELKKATAVESTTSNGVNGNGKKTD